MDYSAFVTNKLALHSAQGISAAVDSPSLFDFQQVIVNWALRKGRAAVFADTGLGKTRMQLAWADAVYRETGHDCMILAPLAVAAQTCAEGAEIGIKVTHCKTGEDVRPGLNIANYERMHQFNMERFGAVVLDESSRIKHHDAKTLALLLDAFRDTPFKLCATATPAPNDWTELGTHAEFLGVCSRSEMLAEFFTHDGGKTQDWRLKGHGREAFWRWVAAWGAVIQSPADLGFDASRYELPPLLVDEVIVDSDFAITDGGLFAREARQLSERRSARRGSMAERVGACAERVNASNDPAVIWCELNAEGAALCDAIPDAVEISGSDTIEEKERRLIDFAAGRIRVLVTKPKIAGFGLNWQHCADVHFIGVIDSFEAYYQAVRRCWRFGQTRQVNVTLYASHAEGAVAKNLKEKEAAAREMAQAMKTETAAAVRDELLGQARQTNDYSPKQGIKLPRFMR